MSTARVRAPGREFVLDDAVLERAQAARPAPGATGPAPARLVFAAAHLPMLPGYAHAAPASALAAHVDWAGADAVRLHLDACGFGVAEAMDTAQRFEIGWDLAAQLICRCGALPLTRPWVAGAATDHLETVRGPADLVEGVLHQIEVIRAAGGWPVLLPMPWLPRNHAPPEQYVEVYAAIVARAEGPLFVHWLGDMFLPELRGYFPGDSFARVMALDPAKVRGAKISLLDAELEVRLRRDLLGDGQLLLTGDDLHFGRLILGGAAGGDPPATAPVPLGTARIAGHAVPVGDFSHGLLGVFDAVAAPMQLALQDLARGAAADFLDLAAPCEALGRHLFAAPTEHYKAGLAFLAWVNGRHQAFLLPRRAETRRDLPHLLRAAELASAAGALQDAPAAAARLNTLLDSA
ncbi:MAG TPA: DUF993 family protein [Planctomycetota bacterium]